MAPLTRAKRNEIYERLVTEFLDDGVNTNFADALRADGLDNLEGLMAMTREDIEDLRVPPGED